MSNKESKRQRTTTELSPELLGQLGLDPFRSSCIGGRRDAMFVAANANRQSMAKPNPPTIPNQE